MIELYNFSFEREKWMKSGWRIYYEKTNESMLDVISYGGYSNQLTADYYPNNQVYNQLISELLKCKSGALLAYDDNNILI